MTPETAASFSSEKNGAPPKAPPGACYVQVALNVPRLPPLTYKAPAGMAEGLAPGVRVFVPLGKRRVTGYVVSRPWSEPPPGTEGFAIKEIIERLDEEVLLTEELLGLTGWVADYYDCGWGEAIRAALPGVPERKSAVRYRLTPAGKKAMEDAAPAALPGLTVAEEGAPLRERILQALRVRSRSARSLASALGRGTLAELERLVAAGLAEAPREDAGAAGAPTAKAVRLIRLPDDAEREKILRRAPKQAAVLDVLKKAEEDPLLLRALAGIVPGARPACAALEKKGYIAIEEIEIDAAPPEAEEGAGGEASPPALTAAQVEAFEAVRDDMAGGRFKVTLLHGVTGSGKTEVYLRLAEEALRRGKTALVLVPEIGLTPQLLARFRARFGAGVACLHSAFPDRRRAAEWRRIRSGEARVALGTRSAVFAPLDNLGLIAVDEEHDTSYKQEEAPRYNGRNTAIVRASRIGIPVVLGSATPSVESYSQAKRGRYRLVHLPGRPSGQPLPKVEIVDLRQERGGDPKTPPLISGALADAMAERLRRGEQTLLFLNRRGFSSIIMCRACGEGLECAHCAAPLTFHMGERRLQCHLCDAVTMPPQRCPHCGSERLGFFGIGTERVEEAVRARFPSARTARLDRDSVRRAGAMERTLEKVRRGEIDVLIGTQMVAKGHDFPRLTLVGVVVADVGLHLPDFRAGERTFQVLTQVAGRAGRAALPGEAIVQTFRPGHYAIQCAKDHDYAAFFEQEIAVRQALGYPPYRRLVRLRFEGRNAAAAADAGKWARQFLESIGARAVPAPPGQTPDIEFLGPAPAPLKKVRGNFRHHMILKGRSSARLGEAVQALRAAYEQEARFRSIQLISDVDPLNLL